MFRENYEKAKAEAKLTEELINSVDPDTEYIANNEIYCKNCNTPRTCFGITQIVRCMCKCQKAEYEKKANEAKQKEREKRVERLKNASLLGERYQHTSFDQTDVHSANFKVVYDRFRKYSEVADEVLNRGIGIYLYGNKGAGKTHLTAALANALMEGLHGVVFTNFAEISEKIRSTFGTGRDSERAFMDKLAEIDFLFIDDFGTELLTKGEQDRWLQEKVFEVVNKRYNNKKPIIFTSNYSLLEMIDKRGLSDKTADRIFEVCELMKLEGESYRAKAKNKQARIF